MPTRYAYPQAYAGYSGGQSWPQQLHPYAPAYTWAYPQYPQYGNVPAMAGGSYTGYPSSPRHRERRRSITPEEIQVNALLGGRYRPTADWDVTQDPSTGRHGRDKISERLLAEPATEPPVYQMRLVSDAFPWDINITPPGRKEVVTVGHVFGAIYGILQNPLEKEDWDNETSNVKRIWHRARCARLSRSGASFKLDSHIKQVDVLGDKTFFMGLKPVGPPEEPTEWLLKLGPPPRQGRR
ncbi:hypothetical protein JB92DRAFT_1818985 [Gautieria morchelliformis]|nr:hypothetical protein JB92DRAFT_1818985 [Gautieria morchelliformis]